MADIIPFKKGDEPKTVDDIIQELAEEGVTDLVVLGYDRDGMEYFTATIEDGSEVVWLLNRLIYIIMDCKRD
jgi:hypothetical protein